MRKNIKKKQYVITAVAGLTLLLVFGGTAINYGRKEDPTPKADTTPSIEIDGGDIDWEFDPTKEITITPTPSSGAEDKKDPPEVPDEDGNLSLNPGEDEEPIEDPAKDLTPIPPEEENVTPTPDLVVEVTPTPVEEPIEEPVEQPTLAPTPTPIEKETTPAPTPIEEKQTTPAPTPIEKETTPAPTPVEKQTTPAPTKAPDKFVEKKNPTLEEDGYTFDDPTGYKVGEVVETVIPVSSGEPLDCIHHQPGDVFAQALDGLERNATYVQRYGDDATYIQIGEQTREVGGKTYTDILGQKAYELVCYGKLPEELIKKYYADDMVFYVNVNGTCSDYYLNSKLEVADRPFTLEELIKTKLQTLEAATVPYGGGQVGSFN